jgi:pimeloyl-ACP methyl ester carboxylesterase
MAAEDGQSGMKQVELGQGTIRYRESGAGEPIVFVHGLLVNGSLWRKVTPGLESDFRCIVPDWPLGSHSPAMRPDADLSPLGLARLVDDFLAAVGLDGVTLVANDTGGAISQLVATHHPGRIGRLVLTPCDAYDNFLPPFFRPLQWLARVPGGLAAALQGTRTYAVRRSPLAFGLLCKHGVDRTVSEGWARPSLDDREVRRDCIKVLRGIDKRYTLEAAELLRSFDRPTLIAWAPEDRFFKIANAERLAAAIPNARLERIDDSYAFVPEDQPDRLTELISEFIGSTQPAKSETA